MAKAKKDMTPKERREQLIKDRAARLARDAAKQGLTPAQLMKKKTDTYINVVGGAASLALPAAAVVRGAGALFKTLTGGSKAAKAIKALPKAKSTKVTTKADKKPTTTKPASQQVIEGKATTKPSSSSKSTAVTTAPSRAVKKPGTKVQQVRQVKDKKPAMKNVTPKKKALPNKAKPKDKSKAVKAAVAAAVLGGAATQMPDTKKSEAKSSTVTGPKPRPKRSSSVATPKPRPKRRTGMSEGNTVAGSSSRRGSDPRKDFASKATPGAKKAAPKKVPTTKSRDKDGQGTGKIGLPAGAKRKFSGGYNSKTEKLRNIGGKTYVFPKK